MLTFIKRIFFFASIPAVLAVAGCSIGYMNLHPGENSAIYQNIFDDVINIYDEPHWLWVRGTIQADLDGNGVVSEELVLATVQQGSAARPGPIEVAFLVACDVSDDGKRTARARIKLFDKHPVPDAPMPENDIGLVRQEPLTRCRAQIIQDKRSLRETVVVYFWGDSAPTSVWYAGFALEDGRLVKNLETVLWQSSPGLLALNLDRSIDAMDQGYQLIFGVAAVPDEVSDKLGPPADAPLWGHVFARDVDGNYRQADVRFGEHYRRIGDTWNRQYLKAVMNGLPDEELAWFEYHMALLNHYAGDPGMAENFLVKARQHARDDRLAAAIEKFADTRGNAGSAGKAGSP